MGVGGYRDERKELILWKWCYREGCTECGRSTGKEQSRGSRGRECVAVLRRGSFTGTFFLGLVTVLSIPGESFIKASSLRAPVALLLSSLYTSLLGVIVLCTKVMGP